MINSPTRKGRGAGTDAPRAGGSRRTSLDHRPEYWRMADALARQHGGRGRVQARRAGPDLPASTSPTPSRRPTRSWRPSGMRARTPRTPTSTAATTYFWVPPEAPLAVPAKPGPSARHRPAGGRRDDTPSSETTRRSTAVLPKDYARAALDQTRLGQVESNLVSNIKVGRRRGRGQRRAEAASTSTSSSSSRWPRAGRAASSTRRNSVQWRLTGGDARALPRRVYDPCCGSSGMFVRCR